MFCNYIINVGANRFTVPDQLISVCRKEGARERHVYGLESMRGMGRKDRNNDLVLVVPLQEVYINMAGVSGGN